MSECPDYRSHKEKPASDHESPHEPEAEDIGEEMASAVEEDTDRGTDANSRGDTDEPASEQSREPSHHESGSFYDRQRHACERHEIIVLPPLPFRKRCGLLRFHQFADEKREERPLRGAQGSAVFVAVLRYFAAASTSASFLASTASSTAYSASWMAACAN